MFLILVKCPRHAPGAQKPNRKGLSTQLTRFTVHHADVLCNHYHRIEKKMHSAWSMTSITYLKSASSLHIKIVSARASCWFHEAFSMEMSAGEGSCGSLSSTQ